MKRTPLLAVVIAMVTASAIAVAFLVRRPSVPEKPDHVARPHPAASSIQETVPAVQRENTPATSRTNTAAAPTVAAAMPSPPELEPATFTNNISSQQAPPGTIDALDAAGDRSTDFTEPYTRQISRVTPSQALEASPSLLTEGSHLVLSLFPDATYTTVVDSVTQDINGVRIIQGHLVGEAMNTFTLSEHEGVVIADLLDPRSGRQFKVKYINSRNEHVAIEYDLTNMPPRYDVEVRGDNE